MKLLEIMLASVEVFMAKVEAYTRRNLARGCSRRGSLFLHTFKDKQHHGKARISLLYINATQLCPKRKILNPFRIKGYSMRCGFRVILVA